MSSENYVSYLNTRGSVSGVIAPINKCFITFAENIHGLGQVTLKKEAGVSG